MSLTWLQWRIVSPQTAQLTKTQFNSSGSDSMKLSYSEVHWIPLSSSSWHTVNWVKWCVKTFMAQLISIKPLCCSICCLGSDMKHKANKGKTGGQSKNLINTVKTKLSAEHLRNHICILKCLNTTASLDREAVSVSLWPEGNFTQQMLLSLILSFTLLISKHKYCVCECVSVGRTWSEMCIQFAF